MDPDLPENIQALGGNGFFDDPYGLAAEAHCRYRGRRLCTVDELQHWNQCGFMQAIVNPGVTLHLGCYRQWAPEPAPGRFAKVGCEFAADMVTIQEGDRLRYVHSIAAEILNAELGYSQLYRVPNDDIWCNGGNPTTRCCLDL